MLKELRHADPLTVKVGFSTMLEDGSVSSCANAVPARTADAKRAGATAVLKRMTGTHGDWNDEQLTTEKSEETGRWRRW